MLTVTLRFVVTSKLIFRLVSGHWAQSAEIGLIISKDRITGSRIVVGAPFAGLVSKSPGRAGVAGQLLLKPDSLIKSWGRGLRRHGLAERKKENRG
jgi:hypothetical protein